MPDRAQASRARGFIACSDRTGGEGIEGFFFRLVKVFWGCSEKCRVEASREINCQIFVIMNEFKLIYQFLAQTIL